MNTFDEVSINNTHYRRVKKLYSLYGALYILIYVSYMIIFLAVGIAEKKISAVSVIIDCLFFKPAIIVCGFMSCYKKNNVFAVSASVFHLINTFMTLSLNCILVIVTIVLTVLTILNNKEYRYLEGQYGFPHFNELQIIQENNKLQRSIKDEFQQNYERLKKTSSDSMGSVDDTHDPFMTSVGSKSEETIENEINSMDSIQF